MATAITPTHGGPSLTILSAGMGPGSIGQVYYVYMHFADVDPHSQNETRVFQVFMDGQLEASGVKPEYLLSTHIRFSSTPRTAPQFDYVLNSTSGSVLSPILNALEVYSTLSLPAAATYRDDVNAMMGLKMLYKMATWQGDPCSPPQFTWTGVSCTFSGSNPPRITSLNLSYHQLSGPIPTALAKLSAIQFLDLSYNIFTGPIPDFLAALQSLRILNLSNNQLNGSIPLALLNRQENGLLDLRTDNNPALCPYGVICNATSIVAEPKGKKLAMHVIVVISVIATVLLVSFIVFFMYLLRRRGPTVQLTPIVPRKLQLEESNPIEDKTIGIESHQFTYQELKTITNDFERVIGKGGFGTVYYGCLLNGTEVAVKMCSRYIAVGITGEFKSEKSNYIANGTKELLAEASILSRVHHRNLVILIGYCWDSNFLGLVYEYADQGSLKDHLSGKAGSGRVLNWRQRLQIAVGAASGLEYLHKGCKPPIIHRDVKTSNILLDHKFEARIADFGLSKAFLTDTHTHVSTEVVVGTPGYVDPEYHNTFQLNEKSDVYSFGVVLLEIVTGLPPVLRYPERGHIRQWVRLRLAQSDITQVVDSRLEGLYYINSILKVIDLALSCTSKSASKRPTLSEVVMQLKESLQVEISQGKDHNTLAEGLHKSQKDSVEMACLDQDSVEMARLDMTTAMSGPIAR